MDLVIYIDNTKKKNEFDEMYLMYLVKSRTCQTFK